MSEKEISEGFVLSKTIEEFKNGTHAVWFKNEPYKVKAYEFALTCHFLKMMIAKKCERSEDYRVSPEMRILAFKMLERTGEDIISNHEILDYVRFDDFIADFAIAEDVARDIGMQDLAERLQDKAEFIIGSAREKGHYSHETNESLSDEDGKISLSAMINESAGFAFSNFLNESELLVLKGLPADAKQVYKQTFQKYMIDG